MNMSTVYGGVDCSSDRYWNNITIHISMAVLNETANYTSMAAVSINTAMEVWMVVPGLLCTPVIQHLGGLSLW